MTETPLPPDLSGVPDAQTSRKSRWSVQWIWLVPLIAALIGGWLMITSILNEGPVISIVFKSAEGLEAGKTKLKYKDVEIGQVTGVTLSADLKQVIATAELTKDFKAHLVSDTAFWLVTPRISGGNVSGLSTVLSGAFIGVAVGKSEQAQRSFTAMDVPPVIQVDTPGREFVLRSNDLGSLSPGSPIFFRRVQVGQVVAFDLDKDGLGLTMRIFINAPYDAFVTENTRFWNAGGIDIKLSASGIEMETQSLASILLGGIAFETPADSIESEAAPPETVFELFSGRTAALHNPERDVLKMVVLFNESLKGLVPGSPVDFQGITLGEVSDIWVEMDPAKHAIWMPVEIRLYPERLKLRARDKNRTKLSDEARRQLLDGLVANGLRAQMRSGNLLTGQLYVALDFFPSVDKASINWASEVPELPTVPGRMEEIQASLKSIAGRLEKLPIEQIGSDLRQTLQAASGLLNRLNTQVTPQITAALIEARQAVSSAQGLVAANKPLLEDSHEAIRELAKTAKTLRSLADYLERHPEALIRGKQEDRR
ncbi:intermembrane transport protein PqiB [Pseudomonas caspiana]